jgi:hypothetical protein
MAINTFSDVSVIICYVNLFYITFFKLSRRVLFGCVKNKKLKCHQRIKIFEEKNLRYHCVINQCVSRYVKQYRQEKKKNIYHHKIRNALTVQDELRKRCVMDFQYSTLRMTANCVERVNQIL